MKRCLLILLLMLLMPSLASADIFPAAYRSLDRSNSIDEAFSILRSHNAVPSYLFLCCNDGTVASIWKVYENNHWWWITLTIEDGKVGGRTCRNHPIEDLYEQ